MTPAAPRAGTSEDLMAIVERAFEAHHPDVRASLPDKTPARRALIEPPAALFGAAVSRLAEVFPADWVLKAHERIFESLSRPYHYPFDGSAPALVRARELSRRVEKEAGRAPALLALISHPPVLGEMLHLNFELVRHAMLSMRLLRGRACRPRMVVAVDRFALDSLPLWEEGIYAGYMGNYHLGLDRLASRRGRLSGCLVRRTSWDRMPRRLLRLLSEGGEAGLVLSGGIPETGRLLYAAREWAGRMRRQSPSRGEPGEALRRLRESPEFLRFEAGRPFGGRLQGSLARRLEAFVMEALSGIRGGTEAACAETGRLSENARKAALSCLEALGYEADGREAAVRALAEELARETPYRGRFFEVVAGEVLKKGRPVVFVPIAHRAEGGLGIEAKDAWAWAGRSGGRVRYLVGSAAPREGEASVEEFAESFVRANFI